MSDENGIFLPISYSDINEVLTKRVIATLKDMGTERWITKRVEDGLADKVVERYAEKLDILAIEHIEKFLCNEEKIKSIVKDEIEKKIRLMLSEEISLAKSSQIRQIIKTEIQQRVMQAGLIK